MLGFQEHWQALFSSQYRRTSLLSIDGQLFEALIKKVDENLDKNNLLSDKQ